MPKFPNWFPPDCPPDTATDASGIVYRIVAGESLSAADFLTYHELGKLPDANPCRRCAVSVFDSFAYALHCLCMSPRLGTAISEGELEAGHGKTQLTSESSGHVSWWAYEHVARQDCFRAPKVST